LANQDGVVALQPNRNKLLEERRVSRVSMQWLRLICHPQQSRILFIYPLLLLPADWTAVFFQHRR